MNITRLGTQPSSRAPISYFTPRAVSPRVPRLVVWSETCESPNTAFGRNDATGKGGFGLVGVNNGPGQGELSQDYFDEGSTGTTTGVGSGPSAGVTGIGGATGLDPHQAASYAGFDFTNVWGIDPGASRPYLLANPQSPPAS